MNDADEARRLLKGAEATEIRRYGAVGFDERLQIAAAWTAIAAVGADGE